MVSEKEVLRFFEESQKTKDQDMFHVKVLEYFIQELDKILANFRDKKHEKRLDDLHSFYLNFEKPLTSKDTEPENHLETEVMDLFLKLTENLNKKEAKQLIKIGKKLLTEYKQSNRKRIIKDVDRFIADEKWNSANSKIDELIAQGYHVEGLVLKAKLYRARHQLILEYGIWNSMVNAIDDKKLLPWLHYSLADVLINLQEPNEAANHFKAAKGFCDAKKRLQAVKKHPMYGHKNIVRGDIHTHGQFFQEVQKYDAMGKRFNSEIILFSLNIKKDMLRHFDKVVKSLSKNYRKKGVENVKIYSSPDEKLKSTKWIKFVQKGKALEFAIFSGTAYAIFNPKKIKNYLAEWDKIKNNKAFKNWCKSLKDFQ